MASGNTINIVKSQIFFFHTPPATQRIIARIIGFSTANLPSKYLGAPLIDSTIKHTSWQLLLEKIEGHLSLWTYRALNMASKLVLVKVVLQTMPLYLFSVLAAPKWVLKKIKEMQCKFLWGSSGQNHKWALVKWLTVCTPKNQGGLGLQDPQHSNAMIGARLWWKWLSAPHTPWAKLWTAKYANNRSSEELIRLTNNDVGSLIWNATIQHRTMIQQHSFWEIRDGGTAHFWVDSWQQRPKMVEAIPPQNLGENDINQNENVSQHWTHHINQGFR